MFDDPKPFKAHFLLNFKCEGGWSFLHQPHQQLSPWQRLEGCVAAVGAAGGNFVGSLGRHQTQLLRSQKTYHRLYLRFRRHHTTCN